MDGQTYQIKLNINVDDSQLSKAERRIRDLERGPGRGRAGRFPGVSIKLPDYPTKVF